MKKHIISLATIVIVMSCMFLVGCTVEHGKAPVTTPTPARATAVPTPEGISISEAKNKAREKVMYSDDTLKSSIRYGKLKIENRVESVKNITIASINLKSQDEEEYIFVVCGNFWGYDKYGRVVDNFNFECEVDVDKDKNGFTFVHYADITI